MFWWTKTKPDPLAKLCEHPVAGGLAADAVRASLAYLRRFGYLRAETLDPETVAGAVRAFRERFGLMPGPSLDRSTEKAMAAPRCGLADHRLATAEARWRKASLTYAVTDYVGGISKADQDNILALAWKQWTDVADLKITRVANASTADIVIGTGRGRADQFDGPSGTLAWAYLPNGRDTQLLCKFDLDETWLAALSPAARGILLLNVACHEFGHLLGLDHSQIQAALMAPYYVAGISKPQQRDDIPRIVALYGAAAPPPPPIPPPPPAPNRRRLVLEYTGDVVSVDIPGFRATPQAA